MIDISSAKRIMIIGGGTVGWFVALNLRQLLDVV
ncbi:MAG: hypothetical protein H6R05_1449 [Burkholderiaceae bacterium]|nr:hypothetical protein [Burkholderiaceae bacterium]